MQASQIERVLVVGAGTMGQQIGLQCALFGCEVVLFDINEQALWRGAGVVRHLGERYVRKGLLEAQAVEAALGRFTMSTDLEEACQGVDLVSESVFEDLDLKREVWAKLGAYCPQSAVLTTNTSTLLPSQFAESTGAPERFLAWHFHLPSLTANVVDVMPHPGTDASIVELMMAFSRRVRQLPLLIEREKHGYVFNTMLVALCNAALELGVEEVVDLPDVDRAWMGIMGMDMGPFGIMDMIGLDTVAHITREALARDPEDAKIQAALEWLEGYLEAGKLGMKAGEGFYSYPRPAYKDPEFMSLD